jgi:hypothetical protein
LSGESLGYTYDLNEVKTSGQESEVSSGEPGLTLPLRVRDETVGQIFVQGLGADDKESIDLANAVAERLGAHIEGLRQYDQTQSALAQSEKLFAASRSLTQATNLQELVNAAVSTLDIPRITGLFLPHSTTTLQKTLKEWILLPTGGMEPALK